MVAIWVAFLLTSLTLIALALLGLSWHGSLSRVLHRVGQHLLLLALITGLYPIALWVMRPAVWARAYVGVVIVLTSVAAWVAVHEARRIEQ